MIPMEEIEDRGGLGISSSNGYVSVFEHMQR
jgi:hypothetical protein